MKKLLVCAWLLVPVGAAAYHYGPGQTDLAADHAAAAAERGCALAREAAAIQERDGDLPSKGTWVQAEEAFAEALEFLPAERVAEGHALRLERAKAQMMVSQLPEARRDLEGLVEELASDPSADPVVLADARSTLANAQYYTTWLMRLEGLPREEWEREIEASRQTFKLLAEQAESAGDLAAAERAKENLESSIRLARMELQELQGMPLPCQCKCSGSGRGQCKGKSKSKGKQAQDMRGAGMGPPPDGSGS